MGEEFQIKDEVKIDLYQSGYLYCRDGSENLVLSLYDLLGGRIFNVSKWKSQPAPAMFVREVVATSDLHQTVRIKLKLLRPLSSDHQNLTYFVPFMSRLKLLSSHSFSIRDCEQCSFIKKNLSFPLEGVDR